MANLIIFEVENERKKEIKHGGIPADHDHSTCAMHCNLLLPFDSLFGGDQLCVKGLTKYAGVNVTYKNASHATIE